MDTNSVIELLSSIPVGTVIAWITIICAMAGSLCTVAVKLYKFFEKYKTAKEKNEAQDKIIQTHEESLKAIGETLNKIKESLDEQKGVNLKQIRHTIVHTCEDALEKGCISVNKLRSLEEMYEEYVEVFHGNGYVKTLMEKVRALPIIGKSED